METKDLIALLAGGQNLNAAQAEEAMRLIMGGQATDSQIAALLMALRLKGETAEELAAFAGVMRDLCSTIHPKTNGILVDTCGTGGDRVKTFNVSTLAAIVVAGAGVYVSKHGNRSVTSRCGSADLMEGFGVNILAPPQTVHSCIEEVGLGFMFAPLFHTAMSRVAKVRRELGVRTVFNLLGPLTNPASAKAQLIGVYDPALTEKFAQVLNRLGVERALVVHGLIGIDEISTLGETRVTELKGGAITTYNVHPTAFGLQEASNVEALMGGDLDDNLETAIRILDGAKGPKSDMVLLNAAAGIVVGGRAERIVEGLELARESIESGRALQKLSHLIKKTGGNLDRLEEIKRKYLATAR